MMAGPMRASIASGEGDITVGLICTGNVPFLHQRQLLLWVSETEGPDAGQAGQCPRGDW